MRIPVMNPTGFVIPGAWKSLLGGGISALMASEPPIPMSPPTIGANAKPAPAVTIPRMATPISAAVLPPF